MTKVLMVCHTKEPTVLISEGLFRKAAEKLRFSIECRTAGEIDRKCLQDSDIVISLRTQDMFLAGCLQAARKAGKITAEISDDDFFAIPDHHIRRPLQEKALLKALHSVDVLISGNRLLAEKMCSIGQIQRKVICDTAVPESDIYPVRPLNQEAPIRIAYYANDSTTTSFDAVIRPILPQLSARYGDRIEWTFFSVHPELSDEWGFKVDYVPRVPLKEFRKKLAEGSFTFGIAPLLDDTFCKGKYVNKFMEYTSAGIPCVYSDVLPYRGFIRDGVNGIICENTSQAWLAAIERMLRPETYICCITNAQQQMRDNYSEDAVISRLVQQFPEINTYQAPEHPIRGLLRCRVEDAVVRMIHPWVCAIGRFRLEGLGSVLRWTIHIAKMKMGIK